MANNNKAYIRIEDVDVSKITFEIPEGNKPSKLGQLANIRYGGREALKILLPPLFIPFSAKLWDENSTTAKVSVGARFDESNPEHVSAIQKIHEIDERILELAYEHRRKLWTKYTTAKEPNEKDSLKIKEDIRNKFSTSIKQKGTEKEGEFYPPLFSMKIRRNSNNPNILDGPFKKEARTRVPLTVKIIGNSEENRKEVLTIDNVGDILSSGSTIQPVIEAGFFFVSKQDMGNITWLLISANVTPKASDEDDYDIADGKSVVRNGDGDDDNDSDNVTEEEDDEIDEEDD